MNGFGLFRHAPPALQHGLIDQKTNTASLAVQQAQARLEKAKEDRKALLALAQTRNSALVSATRCHTCHKAKVSRIPACGAPSLIV